MHLYMHSFLLSMFIIFLLINLRNYQDKTSLKNKIMINVKNDLHVYNVFSCTVTGFKTSRNFASIQRTCEANYIGSIIG